MNKQQRDDRYREKWMSDAQYECWEMLADLFGGFHHLHGKVHEWGDGIKFNSSTAGNKFATYDFNTLTTAVIMAHDRCIRFAIEPSGPGLLALVLHKRPYREGHKFERHPEIQEAIDTYDNTRRDRERGAK